MSRGLNRVGAEVQDKSGPIIIACAFINKNGCMLLE
jgi:hypothetical protein